MSLITRFTELAASFHCVDAQLCEALRSHETTRAHVRLLTRSAELLDRIEGYQPTSREELEEIADHYARRRVEGAGINVQAVARFADVLRRSEAQLLPAHATAAFRSTSVPDPLPHRMEGEDLALLVVHCRGRVSAIGRDNRLIAVSRDEAEAHGLRPSQMLGRPFPELLRCCADEAKERRAVTLALADRPQSHTLGAREDRGERRLRVWGVRCGAGHLYAAIRHVETVATAQRSPATT